MGYYFQIIYLLLVDTTVVSVLKLLEIFMGEIKVLGRVYSC